MVSESDSECSAIVGICHPCDQPVGFEGVYDGHHCVAVNAKSGRQLALGLAIFGRQRHEHRIGPGSTPMPLIRR
jgi:hypothetical protein